MAGNRSTGRAASGARVRSFSAPAVIAREATKVDAPEKGPSNTKKPRFKEWQTVGDIRDLLRAKIESGALRPGMTLNQSHLALELGVSRTPLREAMRMLQEEGLIEAVPNYRARVATFSPDYVEALYAERICLVALATKSTVESLEDRDLRAMEAALKRAIDQGHGANLKAWLAADLRFHTLHESGHGGMLSERLERSARQITFIRRMYWERVMPSASDPADAEHQTIYEACMRRDVAAAVDAAASHIARVGATLIDQAAPDRGHTLIQHALDLVTAGRITIEKLPGFGITEWTEASPRSKRRR